MFSVSLDLALMHLPTSHEVEMNTTLWELPVPASALHRGPFFQVLPKRKCKLSFEFETDDQIVQKELLFQDVEIFKCTHLMSLNPDMSRLAYGKIIQLDSSLMLQASLDAYQLKGNFDVHLVHLMICFDDGPCYEFICRSVEIH